MLPFEPAKGIPGPKVIKLYSYLTQLSMKLKLIVNIEIAENIQGIFRFKSLKPVVYSANKC